MSKIISFKEGKKNLLKNRKKTQIPSSQKTISQIETKKSNLQSTKPEMGILVWLYCPNCKTFQYTESQAPNGRKHKCGAEVMEIEVPLDLTAENTICLKNLSILEELQQQIKEEKEEKGANDILFRVLEHCKKEELSMIEKLQKAFKKKKAITIYYPTILLMQIQRFLPLLMVGETKIFILLVQKIKKNGAWKLLFLIKATLNQFCYCLIKTQI